MYRTNNRKYDVEEKPNQYEKNRCFLVPNGKNLPLGKIRVTESYIHKFSRAIIICSKNGVRKNTQGIWGYNEVISIRKKIPQDFIKQTKTEETLDGNIDSIQQLKQLKTTKQNLISEREGLTNEINYYADELRRERYRLTGCLFGEDDEIIPRLGIHFHPEQWNFGMYWIDA